MIETLPLFRPLNSKLLEVLKNLPKSDWNKKTVAGNWTVKDVAAHLLDGNIRAISIYRDNLELVPDMEINSYQDLVRYLNRLNADWVTAMKRLSITLLVEWLAQTHENYIQALENLEPNGTAKFSVAWAGEEISFNWFHIAREFTEKWHHQQQIRDAVNQPGILTNEFYLPVLETFMQALPFRYRDVDAPPGYLISISVDSINKVWNLQREQNKWRLVNSSEKMAQSKIQLPMDISWRLFTKAISYPSIADSISIEGDLRLALPALNMVTVMA